MNKIDEIRARLEDRGCFDTCEVNTILEIISPYLSHGITEEEARKWFNAMSYSQNQLEFMIEGKNLGLITSSREPIAEPENNSQINNWCKERDEILRLCVESNSNFARKVFNFCGMSSDLISCLKTGMGTNKQRQPIAEPGHTIHALAEDQRDVDPKINKMVNETFWELVGDDNLENLDEAMLEKLYWHFDTEIKTGRISDRDMFKQCVRKFARLHIRKTAAPEPESLVKAREAVDNAKRAYNTAIYTDESETHTAYPQCIDLKDELELLVEELEAHV